MGSIIRRPRRDGSVGYTAYIRIKRGGRVVHTESATFEREAAAKQWLRLRESALAEPGALDKPVNPTLAAVIEQYISESTRAVGKTKAQVLRTIRTGELGELRCSDVSSQALVSYAQTLTGQPQTVGNYFAHLAAIFAVAKPAWGYPLDPQALDDARTVLKRLGRIAKSRQRDRLPTVAELDALMAHFRAGELRRPDSLPMTHLVAFALFSTRRQEEITRLTWADLDAEHREIWVRDMKHPGEKIGNDHRCTMPSEALEIIQRQPRRADEPRIFPFHSDTISARFTRACKLLDIDDLHFHDLRHAGVTRLFEQGWTIPQAATVSGHRSWSSLQRYAHVRHSGDRYAGWASWRV